MSGPRRRGLATNLITAQVIVVAVGALTLALTATVVAPPLFRRHLSRAGITSAPVRRHAEEAFVSTFTLSLAAATAAALLAAGVASWILVRQVSAPIEALARTADALAAGHLSTPPPGMGSSSELGRLSDAFSRMAIRLADTDASRSRLLSDLSHELRTPLATISAYIDGMQDDVLARDAQSWDTMRAQVSRLSRLTTDVRDAAAAQEGTLSLQPRVIDPARLAHDAVDAAAPRFATRGVHLSYAGPTTGLGVVGDPERLAQVLANLLDNALRHTPSGGHVTLGVRSAATHVLLVVTDDGDGIATDQLEAVFDRFHRGEPSRATGDDHGSGLGLTIALAIVTTHAGTLVAASPGVGHGTTVTMSLPASTMQSPQEPR